MTRRGFLWRFIMALPVSCGLIPTTQAAVAKRLLPPIDVDYAKEGLVVSPRANWTTMVPRPWRMREAGGFDRITVHHTAGEVPVQPLAEPKVIEALNSILQDHWQRQYGDIGYHFLLDRAGRIWECRSLVYEGAHVVDQNERNIGVVLLGNYEIQEPTGEQVGSLMKLLGLLRRTFDIKLHRIYGHRDLGQSLCPGRRLYPLIEQLKS